MWSYFEVDEARQRRAERLAAAEEEFIAEIRQKQAALQGVVVQETQKEDSDGTRTGDTQTG